MSPLTGQSCSALYAFRGWHYAVLLQAALCFDLGFGCQGMCPFAVWLFRRVANSPSISGCWCLRPRAALGATRGGVALAASPERKQPGGQGRSAFLAGGNADGGLMPINFPPPLTSSTQELQLPPLIQPTAQ